MSINCFITISYSHYSANSESLIMAAITIQQHSVANKPSRSFNINTVFVYYSRIY